MNSEITPAEVYKAALQGSSLGAKIALHTMGRHLREKGFYGEISVMPLNLLPRTTPSPSKVYRFRLIKRVDDNPGESQYRWDIKQAVVEAGYKLVEPVYQPCFSHTRCKVFDVFLPLNGLTQEDTPYCIIASSSNMTDHIHWTYRSPGERVNG